LSAREPPQAGDDLTELYREAIRRHAADPTGYRRPLETTHSHEIYNPLCGDRIEVRFRLVGEAVKGAAFDGEACAICLASASLLCGLAPGETVTQVRQMATELEKALRARPVGADSSATGPAKAPRGGHGHLPSRMNPLLQGTDTSLPETLHPLLGVRPYPSRVRCATLPWEATVRALEGDSGGT